MTTNQTNDHEWVASGGRDLTDSFGLILTMPPGALDIAGLWWYGVWGPPTVLDSEAVSLFIEEMKQLLEEQQTLLTKQQILNVGWLEDLRSDYYQIGPAAESWPSYFFDICQLARPFVGDGADLLAWGYFFKGVLESTKRWSSTKNEQWPTDDSVLVRGPGQGAAPVKPRWEPIALTPVLTRMAVLSLCFQHAVDKYGLGGSVIIDTFPRGWYFGDVEHPQGWESYLFRVISGSRNFYYQVTGTGLVQQHFLLTDNDVTLLEIPDFGHPKYQEGHRALPAERTEVTIS